METEIYISSSFKLCIDIHIWELFLLILSYKIEVYVKVPFKLCKKNQFEVLAVILTVSNFGL